MVGPAEPTLFPSMPPVNDSHCKSCSESNFASRACILRCTFRNEQSISRRAGPFSGNQRQTPLMNLHMVTTTPQARFLTACHCPALSRGLFGDCTLRAVTVECCGCCMLRSPHGATNPQGPASTHIIDDAKQQRRTHSPGLMVKSRYVRVRWQVVSESVDEPAAPGDEQPADMERARAQGRAGEHTCHPGCAVQVSCSAIRLGCAFRLLASANPACQRDTHERERERERESERERERE